MNEMLPCPFCGKPAEKPVERFQGGSWNFIHRCKIIGPVSIERSTPERIAEVWNTRA